MKNVKNIIFDLGGIFLNLNYQLTRNLFIEYGVIDFDDFYTQSHANKLFEDLETGKITPIEFYDSFRKETKTQLSNEQIETAWNAMLVSFSKERIDWLKEIQKRYNTFLFSNTNQIHYEAIFNLYKRDVGNDDFNAHFIKPYYSHQMGLRKPYEDAYLHILEEQNLIAAETVFVDDTYKNIVGANAVGLQTIFLEAPRTVLDLEF